MPDIKTALENALQKTKQHMDIPKEWDDEQENTKVEVVNTQPNPERTHNFGVTNNVTRATFECVRDNPGSSRPAITDILEARGYKRTSVSALLRHMVLQGLIRENGGGLFAAQKEYTPIKTSLLKQAREKQIKKKPGRKPAQQAPAPAARPAGLAALPTAAPLPPGVMFKASTSELLETLSVTQARALYDELRKIFGG